MIHSSRCALPEDARADGPPAQWDALVTAHADQRRLGHLIHDSLCQELAGISFALEAMQNRFKEAESADARNLSAISRSIIGAMEHAKGIARELDPVSPRPEGLAHALCDLARRTGQRKDVSCQFHRRGLRVLVHDAIVATSFYRIAEQALREAIEVEGCRSILLDLSLKSSVLQMSVQGAGPLRRARAMGVRGSHRAALAHRAASIGATLEFDRNLQRGFTVTCSLPIRTGRKRLAELQDDHD